MKTLSQYLPLRFSAITYVFASLLSFNAVAQNEGRWYQVELLIFKRSEAIANHSERWHQNPELNYPKKIRYLPQTLPNNTHELGGHNYTLRRSEDYQVLFHEKWQQQMWGEENTSALIIRGGQSFGQHKELEGTVKIHIGRYLHLTTDLWLSEFNNTDLSRSQSKAYYQLPPLPGAQQSGSDFFTERPSPSRIITVREKRSMRSKETHYIDHPLVGIIVRMLPIKAPK